MLRFSKSLSNCPLKTSVPISNGNRVQKLKFIPEFSYNSVQDLKDFKTLRSNSEELWNSDMKESVYKYLKHSEGPEISLDKVDFLETLLESQKIVDAKKIQKIKDVPKSLEEKNLFLKKLGYLRSLQKSQDVQESEKILKNLELTENVKEIVFIIEQNFKREEEISRDLDFKLEDIENESNFK